MQKQSPQPTFDVRLSDDGEHQEVFRKDTRETVYQFRNNATGADNAIEATILLDELVLKNIKAIEGYRDRKYPKENGHGHRLCNAAIKVKDPNYEPEKKVEERTKRKENKERGIVEPGEVASKPKDRSTYEGQRLKFHSASVTKFERDILDMVISAGDELAKRTPIAVAEALGVTINRVNGASSVLLAKGCIVSERMRIPQIGVHRVISVTEEGKLAPVATKTTTAPKPQKESTDSKPENDEQNNIS